MEQLIGGPCDGLELQKCDNQVMYSGITGNGKIEVYERQIDGKLHWARTELASMTIQYCSYSVATTVSIEIAM